MSRFITLAALLLTACEEETMCTEEARASIQFTISDGSGNPVDNASATFTPEGGAETDCDALTEGGASFTCGYEVEGSITIKVTADGFQPFEDTIEVSADECHVITEELAVTLQVEAS